MKVKREGLSKLLFNIIVPLREIVPNPEDPNGPEDLMWSDTDVTFHKVCKRKYSPKIGSEILNLMDRVLNEE